MGRESRRARKEGLDRGDVGRMVMAHGECTQLLANDLRIEQHYRRWVAAHDGWDVNPQRTRLQAMGMTDAVIAAAVARTDIEVLAAVLRPMGVPWRWCAEALILVYFPTIRHNELHPADQRVVNVSAGIKGRQPGRAPRKLGQDVATWVQWWYRHKVKQPSDSIYAMAQEYAEREKRHTRADSVVVDGIQRAERLLNSVISPTAAS